MAFLCETLLFLGTDPHALSVPALASALEVLAANEADVMISGGDEYTPTPAISHAILTYNRGRTAGFADGIVITPSHNPPGDGGFKYNPPSGGPAEDAVTGWIEAQANNFLENGLSGVERVTREKALRAGTTHRYDYLDAYVADLADVLDMDVIRTAKICRGVDPLPVWTSASSNRDGSLPFLDLDPVHQDLRAVVVGHVAQ